MATSGPWFWAGSGPFSLNRGGVLITPWGEGTWSTERGVGVLGKEKAAAGRVFADFANSQHELRMLDGACLRVQSTRKADGELVGVDYAGVLEGARDCATP